MNNFDEEAFVREMQHKEMLSKQREGSRTWADEMVDMLFDNNYSEIKDDNNEK